jgi:hypothetical protein
MSKRTDIHRPSAIDVNEYEYVAFEYIKTEDLGDCGFLKSERAIIKAHMDRTGGTYSRHEHGGNCHICGAHAIYTVLFYHELTNTYIRTGQDCAEKLEFAIGGDMNAFRTALKDALELQAGKRKALAVLTEAGHEAAWPIYTANEYQVGGKEETIIDIVGKLVRYGSVSEKSINYLGSLLYQIANRATIEAERKAQTDAAAPVPSGRIVIEGIVLTTRVDDTPYGTVTKMLVQHDTGWKVWGSKPSSLNVTRGARIRFTATVEASPTDLKFGFYSRPSKATMMEPVGVGGEGCYTAEVLEARP